MANITVQRDPACITNVERHQFNGSLIEWLTANEQFNFGGLHAYITLNGRVIINTAEMTPEQCDDAAQTVVGEGDNVLIIIRPQGLDPFTLAVIVFAAAVAVSYLAFSQLIPNLKQDQGEGPGSNNQLNSASNDYRPWGAVADIAGQIVSYPDFVQLSYYTYNSQNRKEFREIFVVGVGYYDEALIASTIKDGETLISDIGGSSVDIYGPGSTPPNLLNVRAVQSAEQIDLIAPDGVIGQVVVTSGKVYSSTQIIIDELAVKQAGIEVGSSLDFTIDFLDQEQIVNTEYGTGTVSAVSGGLITFSDFFFSATGVIIGGYIVNNNFSPADIWYTLEGDSIERVRFHLRMPYGIRAENPNVVGQVTAALIIEMLDSSGNPTGVTVSRGATFTGRTQQYLATTYELLTPYPGKVRAKATRATNSLGDNAIDLLQLERLESVTPYGLPIVLHTENLSVFVFENSFFIDPVTQQQLEDLRLDVGDLLSIVIPSMSVNATLPLAGIQPYGSGTYSLRFNILPSGITTSLGVIPISITNESKNDLNFGDVTLLDVRRVTPPTGGASSSSNKINCVAQRLLRVYNHNTGVYSTDYTATRRFCDYVFYVLHEQMQVPIANINTEQLFGIHDNLSDSQLGLFDYSFDDKNVEARERIKSACNAARVVAWEDGQVWSFVRDEAKPVSVAHFDRRNTIGGQAQYEHSFRLPSDYDSVSLRYVDPDKNVQKVISKRINSAGAIVDGAGSRPLEFELIGCRNLTQAMNRLNLEIRRLIYQRVQVTDTVIMDALTVGKWQRVSWSDVWDGQTFDGEILDVAGNVYSTSERFEPESGAEYWVYITDVNGNPSNTVRAYPRADGNIYGFEATGLTGAYLKTGTQQLGSRYFIATTADMTNSLFLLDGRGRPNERGETSVTLIEYNQAMYEAD